jgi:two-component system chemotaxis response regulator CheY
MSRDKFTIMVVDDDKYQREIVLSMAKHILKAECYEAENGKEAVKKYKEKEIDLVISDLEMPVMNGLEMLKEIIAYDKNAMVIITSGSEEKGISKKMISAGAKEYLTKPYSFMKLINKIKNEWQKYISKKKKG